MRELSRSEMRKVSGGIETIVVVGHRPPSGINPVSLGWLNSQGISMSDMFPEEAISIGEGGGPGPDGPICPLRVGELAFTIEQNPDGTISIVANQDGYFDVNQNGVYEAGLMIGDYLEGDLRAGEPLLTMDGSNPVDSSYVRTYLSYFTVLAPCLIS